MQQERPLEIDPNRGAHTEIGERLGTRTVRVPNSNSILGTCKPLLLQAGAERQSFPDGRAKLARSISL